MAAKGRAGSGGGVRSVHNQQFQNRCKQQDKIKSTFGTGLFGSKGKRQWSAGHRLELACKKASGGTFPAASFPLPPRRKTKSHLPDGLDSGSKGRLPSTFQHSHVSSALGMHVKALGTSPAQLPSERLRPYQTGSADSRESLSETAALGAGE